MSVAEQASKASGQKIYPDSMTEHDLNEVVEIEETCGLSRWGWEAYHEELLSGVKGLMLVARIRPERNVDVAQRVTGFVASRLAADELHINNIAVREGYRRCGIASALLSAVKAVGVRLRVKAYVLEVRASNDAAQALYSRHGFRIVGRRKKYYNAPVEDALVMRAENG